MSLSKASNKQPNCNNITLNIDNMPKVIQLNRFLLAFLGIISIYLFCIFLSQSNVFLQNSNLFSKAITFDLLISAPLVYFLLIRKTKVTNKTTIIIFVLGIIIGIYIIPKDNQQYIQLAIRWVLPVIELSIIAFVIYKVVQKIKQYKANNKLNLDYYNLIKSICQQILPKRVSNIVATEIAIFYYGFFAWKKNFATENQYTGHKKSGIFATLGVLMFMTFVEAGIVHLLVSRWNNVVAWIVTGLSLYSVVMLFGILKSIPRRLTTIEKENLVLRYGILSDANIRIDDIESIILSQKDLDLNDKLTKTLSPFSFLEGYNTIIKLKTEKQITGIYGFTKKVKKIGLNIDDKEKFKIEINKRLNK